MTEKPIIGSFVLFRCSLEKTNGNHSGLVNGEEVQGAATAKP